ncbi:hypothetical protein PSNIH1_15030 [Pantoea sp. PSNIH1]|nr:hypothetical protein PSNIH1_15030 [Pantoea sp. PSNIH1]
MKARGALSTSGRRLKRMRVPLTLFLLMWLTACADTEKEYVQLPAMPVPAELLADCEIPPVPDPMTWGDSLELNERLMTSVENCNRDKRAIRKIESLR